MNPEPREPAGVYVAAHFGPDRGVALKASDYEACALCVDCHRHWHNHGVLPGRDRAESMSTQWAGALSALSCFQAVTFDEDAHRELAQLAAVHVQRLGVVNGTPRAASGAPQRRQLEGRAPDSKSGRKPDGTYVGTLGEWPATHRPGLVLELRVEPQHQTQGTER